eukprot:jgi/Tetstr1/443751/TSEL_031739.t1
MEARASTLQLAAALGDAELLEALLGGLDDAAGPGGAGGAKPRLSSTAINRCRPDNGRPPLVEAALAGQADKVREILAAPGTNVNETTIPDGTSALHAAARAGQLEAAQLLLAHRRINPNLPSAHSSATALHEAAGRGHAGVVAALLAAPGTDANARTRPDGATPLILAAAKGRTQCVAALLACEAVDVNLARERNGLQRTALMEAIDGGHASIVSLLLTAPDVDAGAPDARGLTPLCQAAMAGHPDCLKALLAGMRPEHRSRADLIRALHLAVDSGASRAVETLLSAGAPVRGAEEEGGEALLLSAAQRGRTACVEALLAAGADVNVRSKGAGVTALMLAAGAGRHETVAALLVAEGCEVNTVCSGGPSTDGRSFSALHFAAVRGHSSVVDLLLRHPSTRRDVVDATGRTAFAYARAMGHEEVARLLSGKDPATLA